MLILYTEAKVEIHSFEAFQDYYYFQLPKKVNVKGFEFGYRYQNLQDPLRFITIYGIKNETFLESLLSRQIAQRDPMLQILSEQEQGFVLDDIRLGVYQLKQENPSTTSLLKGNSHLTVELWDWKEPQNGEELNHEFDAHYTEEILNYPDHFVTFRFEILDDPRIDYTNTAPKNLLLVEFEPLIGLEDNETYEWVEQKRNLVQNLSIFSYRPIAKHWKSH
ncbi:MAG: hypothetical protein K940chlam8_00177 [Chlamydiae bacterium]|nr:hypothetical protein [Chlamydiota bacterium]